MNNILVLQFNGVHENCSVFLLHLLNILLLLMFICLNVFVQTQWFLFFFLLIFFEPFLLFLGDLLVPPIKRRTMLHGIEDDILGELYEPPRSITEFCQDVNNAT